MSQHDLNVDQEEIQKFDALADTWWQLDGPMRMLHQINPIRLDYISKYTHLEGNNVLDIGCGAGILAEALAKEGAHVTAIDLSEAAIATAQSHAKKNNLSIHYEHKACEILATEQPHQFNNITCMEMLEHVPDPAQLLQSISQLLAPGGTVFLSTINRTWLGYVNAVLGAEYLLKLLPIGTHRYDRFIKPSELAAWCREASLSFKGLTGVRYNPLTDRLTLSANSQVNYMAHAIKAN